MVKNQPAMFRRPRFNPWIRKIPWRRKWLPTPVFLPGESHGQRSLACYSPWGHKESDTAKQLTLFFTLLTCMQSCRMYRFGWDCIFYIYIYDIVILIQFCYYFFFHSILWLVLFLTVEYTSNPVPLTNAWHSTARIHHILFSHLSRGRHLSWFQLPATRQHCNEQPLFMDM